MNFSSKLINDEFNLLVDYTQDYFDGISKLLRIKPSIVFFGASKAKDEDFYYKLAYNIAAELVNRNFGVITGGGPGLMEAVNRGAAENFGSSCGVNIKKDGIISNKYIDRDKDIRFKYFSFRKICMTKVALGFVILPGGIGTLDELFTILAQKRVYSTNNVPVVLVGSVYWSGLFNWLTRMQNEFGYVDSKDLNSFVVSDNPKEIGELFTNFYKDKLPILNF